MCKVTLKGVVDGSSKAVWGWRWKELVDERRREEQEKKFAKGCGRKTFYPLTPEVEGGWRRGQGRNGSCELGECDENRRKSR
jgi:hypothetical protein